MVAPEPLVSAIVPNFNGAKTIERTIQSILKQDYPRIELIICDDNSTDGSLEILERLAASDSSIRILKNKFAKGVAGARSTGIEAARGNYLAFLDSDDLWRSNKVSRQLGWMIERKSDFSFTWYDLINDKSEVIASRTVNVKSLNYSQMLKENKIACSTVMLKKEILQGLLIDERDWYGDYTFWLAILKKTPRADCLQEKLTEYRVNTKSLSSNKFKAAAYFYGVLKDIEELPLAKRLYYFAHYLFNGLVFKLFVNLKYRFLTRE
jgi:teichuronic acid biosynthesis glycosyltransferase TuaG